MLRRRTIVYAGLLMVGAAQAIVACGEESTTGDESSDGGDPSPSPSTTTTAPTSSSGHDAGAPNDGGPNDAASGDGAVGDASGADATAVDSGPPPEITLGATDRILLTGTVVSPDTAFEGEVLVEGSKITCVGAPGVCAAMPNAVGATIIVTNGIIAPGLVDTHNHILFDIFDDDDWLPTKLYANHNEWTAEARYGAMLDVKQCLANDSQGKPTWCASTPYGTAGGSLRCEMDKWGELKGLIAGTTSIVGLAGTTAACVGSLARSIDATASQNGTGQDKIQTSAIFPPSDPVGVCQNFDDGTTNAFLVHVGEGTDSTALGEFQKLAELPKGDAAVEAGCLVAPQTTITHGTAFTATQFATMAAWNMKLTWSPRSNFALYGATTDIPAARAAGVTIALGPDWSMGGSQNMLDELAFADAWDNAHWGNSLTTKDLVVMATKNGATALGLTGKIGSLEVNAFADITVFAGDRTNPYDAIVRAKPNTVRLVMVGGVPLYGDKALEAAAPAAPGCETLAICGQSKFMCVATTSTASKLNQTHADIKSTLEAALVTADSLTVGDAFNFSPLAPLVKCP